jgi:hypothetical protein
VLHNTFCFFRSADGRFGVKANLAKNKPFLMRLLLTEHDLTHVVYRYLCSLKTATA